MKRKLLFLLLLTSMSITACGNSQSAKVKDYENWANYVVSIDGIKVELPMTYKEFVELGFACDSKYEDKLLTEQLDDFKLKPNFYGFSDKYYGILHYTENTRGISVLLDNDSAKEKAIGDCSVIGISLPHAEEGTEQDRQFYAGTIKIINKDNGEELTVGSSSYDEFVDFFYGSKGTEVFDSIVFTPPELENTDDDYGSHYISIYFGNDGISDDHEFDFRNLTE